MNEWTNERMNERANENMKGWVAKLTDHWNVFASASKIHWSWTHQKIRTSQMSDAWVGDDQTWINMTQNNCRLHANGRCRWKGFVGWLESADEMVEMSDWIEGGCNKENLTIKIQSKKNEFDACCNVGAEVGSLIAKVIVDATKDFRRWIKVKGRLNCWNVNALILCDTHCVFVCVVCCCVETTKNDHFL